MPPPEICYLCQTSQLLPGEQWHNDHVVPKAKGGSDEAFNRRRCHGLCNMWKGARPLTPEMLTTIARRRRVEVFIELG